MLDHSADAPCPTVAQAWERWVLPSYERRVDEGTFAKRSLDQYRSAWNRHIKPTWSDTPLDAVRPLAVQQWISGLTYSQALVGVKVLSAIMDAAVRYECVEHNPMREKYLMPSKTTVQQHDKGIWTLAELMSAWDALRGQWFEPAFILAAFGGCRVGESLGVMAHDVELRRIDGVPVALVDVSKQVDAHGNVSGTLKTDESKRVAIVSGRAALRLAEIAADMPSDWYLTNDGFGGAQSQSRLVRAWSEFGMAHPFRNLRNSWQTWMRWEVGLPPYYIEPLMGHKVRGVTGQHYDRPTPEVLAAAVARAYDDGPWDAT
jgi:integrase